MPQETKIIVVTSRLKEEVSRLGLRCDGALADAVSKKVLIMLKQAAARTTANNRTTMRPGDL